MVDIQRLESLLASGQDTAMLRFTLGSAYAREKQYAQAVIHLARAVELDPEYSAAWKTYARCLMESGDVNGARDAFERGLAVARRRGDMQAVREMEVWQRRLKREA
ncbi:MAG: tetratricopeptide repeat protein [Gammaproteobacteria bacterium]|nr:tetratricopeptide repeat protein [Gammaproteobacteria bacterium]